MLNPHIRRTLGKAATDLYDAGNRQESLYLLRKLAEASEWPGETSPPIGWLDMIDAGENKIKRLRAWHNGK
jgi:hypothetical protein